MEIDVDLAIYCFLLVVARGKLASANKKHYPDLGRDTSSVCKFFSIVRQTSFCGETSHDAVRCQLFLRACLHGGGGPQVGEVTRLGGVTRPSI